MIHSSHTFLTSLPCWQKARELQTGFCFKSLDYWDECKRCLDAIRLSQCWWKRREHQCSATNSHPPKNTARKWNVYCVYTGRSLCYRSFRFLRPLSYEERTRFWDKDGSKCENTHSSRMLWLPATGWGNYYLKCPHEDMVHGAVQIKSLSRWLVGKAHWTSHSFF